MNRYYALVSTNSSEGLHERVSADAETLEAAKALFAAEYGAANVVSVWGEREAALPRNNERGR